MSDPSGVVSPRVARAAASADQVCAVIVTYNCGERVLHAADHAVEQVHHVIVVDNGSGIETLTALDELEGRFGPKVTVVRNATNFGIAAALNQAGRHALGRGYEWLLTLDQDSVPGNDMVSQMLTSVQQYPARDRLGIVAPYSMDSMSQTAVPLQAPPRDVRAFAQVSNDAPTQEVWFVHTSGNLVNTRLFAAGFWFREDYFMDCVDFEFCLRIARAGFTIVIVREAEMVHTIGEARMVSLWGKKFTYSTHSAPRQYFMVRNAIVLFRETRNWKFLQHYLPFLVLHLGAAVLWEDAKVATMGAMARGCADGILGRMGPG